MDKNKKTFQVPTLLAFAAIVAIMVIVGVRVLNVPVVPMCLLVIIEAVIAVMLHHAELWVHGLLILAELCAGVAGEKTVFDRRPGEGAGQHRVLDHGQSGRRDPQPGVVPGAGRAGPFHRKPERIIGLHKLRLRHRR